MRHRWLLQNLITREIRARYLGSVTGFLWALIQPLALLAIYAFVFSTIFQVRFPELEGHRFVTFVAVVLWPWQMLSDGLQRGMTSIQANAGLVQKVAFPREILVYASLASAWLIHIAGYAAVIAALMLLGEAITLAGLPLALLTLTTLCIFTAGVALALSALHVFVRDVEHAFAPVLMVLFYATPILYPLTLVPENLRGIIRLNPVTYIAERLRDGLLHAGSLAWNDLFYLAGAVLVFALGMAFFRRLAVHFEDFL